MGTDDEKTEMERPKAVVDVLVPVAIETAFSYRVPPGLTLAPGDSVRVSLGTRETLGVVWSLSHERAGENLKPVIARVDAASLRPALRRFIDWMARYTLTPRGLVARLALRDPESGRIERPVMGVRLTERRPERMTPARARAIAAAEGGLLWRKSALAEAAGCSGGVIDTLTDEGVFESLALPPSALVGQLDADHAVPALSVRQAEATEALRAAARAGAFSTTLLEGVTGSGKTEVYMEAVAETLRRGRQTLVLVPEIALTPEFLARFARRFGAEPAAWHSAIPSGRRDRLWHAIASGEIPAVVGARSALFLPYADLGLIVVDEEHEAAYKQDEGVRYHARDMAVVRGRHEGAAVILCSATPSIESQVNAAEGRYQHVRLPDRHGGRALPPIGAIDLRRHPPARGRWLAAPTIAAALAALEADGQVLFFLNRRGYAPLTLCRTCGHRWQCPHCAAWLVEHRFRRALVCHHCGHVERRPERCAACGTDDSLIACGPGIERLAEEIASIFPDRRTIALSSDFPGGTERLKRELAAVAEGEFQIVIGTQLIAKGHNFPLLTLAVVVDADVGLANGDPRAAERTMQLMVQVTGRAGRGDQPGRGLIQTHQPDHPVMAALIGGDLAGFYAAETAARREAGLPPFGRLAAIIVSGRDRAAAETHARAIARAGHDLARAQDLVMDDEFVQAEKSFRVMTILGPAEAPLALIRGRYRFRLIVKAPRDHPPQALIRAMLRRAGAPKGSVRVDVDIDPISFL